MFGVLFFIAILVAPFALKGICICLDAVSFGLGLINPKLDFWARMWGSPEEKEVIKE